MAQLIPFPTRPADLVPDRLRAELAEVTATLEEHGPPVAAALASLDLLRVRVERLLRNVEEKGFLDALRAVGLDRALELAWTVADTAEVASG